MRSLKLDIPEEILDEARIPPSERESTLPRELAVHLSTRELLPKTAARSGGPGLGPDPLRPLCDPSRYAARA